MQPTDDPKQQMRRLSRRGFVRGAAFAGVGLLGWKWLTTRSTDQSLGIPWPLRRTHEFNEWLFGSTYSNHALAPEFPIAEAVEPKPNGFHGQPNNTDPATWQLQIRQDQLPLRKIALTELDGLPRVEMTTEFKCVEGWSRVVNWTGIRLSDFMDHFQLGRDGAGNLLPYVALRTPNDAYYVALDMPSARHPQTILAERMNGESLNDTHGGPLRLVITVKYGIKNIKWVNQIDFTRERPADYWADRGYDWYAGL